MRTKILFLLVAVLVFGAMVAMAADVTGKWSGEMEGRNGSRTVTFDLKQDGMTLTGTTTGMGRRGGEAPPQEISEGKVEGDNISFAVVREFNGNEFKTMYKGTVSGTEMKLTVETSGGRGGGQPRELVLKKQ